VGDKFLLLWVCGEELMPGLKKSLCSCFKGNVNPLIMLPRISKSSAIPLWESFS